MNQDAPRALRKTLDALFTGRVEVRTRAPESDGSESAEIWVDKVFLGVAYRDEEDGEASWAVHITILDQDMATS